jgi:dTDP-4-amino-4,6-dideoxygalactose transaminase
MDGHHDRPLIWNDSEPVTGLAHDGNGQSGNCRIRACYSFTPNINEIKYQLEDIFESGLLSNFGKYYRLLESLIANFLDVEFALTVPNASTGLQMILSTLRKGSEVIVPSFTFPATVHAIVHAGLKPTFVAIDRKTYNIGVRETAAKVNSNTSAILAVNIFGNPCSINHLERIAQEFHIKLFFDSACALGSKFRDRRIGTFGDAEVFSLSGTKIVTAGEGGVITTNDKELADKIKYYRNYGYSDDKEDCLYVGFNGKLDEFSAILGLWSVKTIGEQIDFRKELAGVYHQELKSIDGIQFQSVPAVAGCKTNYSFFAIEIDPEKFGIDASALKECLKATGIETIRYFSPPVHKTTAYKEFDNQPELIHTERLSQDILCLPLHLKLNIEQIQRVCCTIKRIHKAANEITKSIKVLHKKPMAEKVEFILHALDRPTYKHGRKMGLSFRPLVPESPG